ncbi:hypothetical protein CBL_10090 [Carabus blaptoides fortunei]
MDVKTPQTEMFSLNDPCIGDAFFQRYTQCGGGLQSIEVRLATAEHVLEIAEAHYLCILSRFVHRPDPFRKIVLKCSLVRIDTDVEHNASRHELAIDEHQTCGETEQRIYYLGESKTEHISRSVTSDGDTVFH